MALANSESTQRSMTSALEMLKPSVDDECYRPHLFRLSIPDDRESMTELLKSQPAIRVYDQLHAQLRDLIGTRHPARRLSVPEKESLISEYLRGTTVEQYGVWAYYPWSMRLVHLLDESEFAELRTNRNRYKITLDEQATLARKRIGVVGLSVGQSAALILALERSFSEMRLADFDTLDLSNLNRLRAGVHNLNVPKVYITAREIAEIDPYLPVTCFPDGITEGNCDAFLMGGSPLDIVIEECDSIDIKILVRYRSRLHRIPVVMETSDRGLIDVERFDLEPERPIFHDLLGDVDPTAFKGLTTEQKIPYILKILGVHALSTRLRASLVEIEQSIVTWPQLASAVAHGGAVVADTVRRICLGQQVLSGRYSIDLESIIGSIDSVPATSETGADKPGVREWQDLASKLPGSSLPAEPISGIAPALVQRLVGDATLAPSGGNCQPWKWISTGGRLYLFHDRSRSYTPFDRACLGGFVALGAATENLMISAHAAGVEVVCDLSPDPQEPDLVVRFHIGERYSRVEPHWRDALYSMIKIRRTNRNLCSRRPLQADDIAALTSAVRSVEGADVYWLTTDNDLQECGEVLGSADRILFLTELFHKFLVSEIRWTPEEAVKTRDGVSLESLALSPADEAAFQVCRHWPVLQTVRRLGGGQNLERASRKALSSASAVGLITMSSDSTLAYVWGGRAVERAWLTATERHIAVHPMTTLPYILAQLHSSCVGVLDPSTEDGFQALRPRYQRLFPVSPTRAHVFLFRLSAANETNAVSMRRPLNDILMTI